MQILLLQKIMLKPKETITIDGSEYPLIKREITNTPHPFHTGKMKKDSAGFADKFKNRYSGFKQFLNKSK